MAISRRNFFAFGVQSKDEPVESKDEPASMTRRMGPHGEQVSLLGYGAMRFPTLDGGHTGQWNNGATSGIDMKMVQSHIDYCIAHGVNYFDTAPVYCKGQSEECLGKCLSKHPRSSYHLATKLSNFAGKLQTFEASKAMYEKSFENLQTDYIDFYLLHSIGGGDKNAMKLFNKRFIDNGMLDFLVKEREAGRIRNLGFSFHGSEEVFRHALSLHEKVKWDFALIQLNYVDWRHAEEVSNRNINAEKLYGMLAEKGLRVAVMEPLFGGRLAKFNKAMAAKMTPLDLEATPAKWAFRFAGSHKNVMTVLSGMSALEHIEENVETFSPLKPFSNEEYVAIERAAKLFLGDDSIPCTSCNYCMPCPYGLDIPAIFNSWNQAFPTDRLPDDNRDPEYAQKRREFIIEYERSVPKLRRAERCTGCGRCVSHCPQAIDIPAKIRKVGDFVEKLRREGRV